MLQLLSEPLFIIFSFMTITGVVSTISYYWSKVRRAEIEAALKQEMIQRGMSADEIEKVLAASGKKTDTGKEDRERRKD